MSAGSTSVQAIRDQFLADFDRRPGDRLRFASIKHTALFYYPRREAMDAPLGQHPRGGIALDGSTAVVRVDGGSRSDADELQATLATISKALEALQRRDRCAHDIFRLHWKWGLSFTEIEDLAVDRETALQKHGPRARYIAADITTALPRDANTASTYAAVAGAFLLGRLQGDVIKGSPRGPDDRAALRQTYTDAWRVRALQDRGHTLREIERMVRSPSLAPEDMREEVLGLPKDAAALSRLSRVAEAFLVARRVGE